MLGPLRAMLALVAVGGLLAVGVVFADAATNRGSDAQSAGSAQYSSGGLLPDLAVSVTASATTTPAAGGELDFYVTVFTKNLGGASTTRLTVNTPAGWTYDHAVADRGPGCTGAPPVLTCNPGWINPSSTTHFTFFGKVAQQGQLFFAATVKSTQEPEFDPSNNAGQLTISTTPPASSGGGATSGGGSSTPAVHSSLAVVGKAVVGGTLKVAVTRGARIQWQVCNPRCKPIRGATKPTLKLTAAYAGETVRAVVTVRGKAKTSKGVRVKKSARVKR